MAYVARITNTKINPLTLYYRVPGNEEKRQLISIHIPSRALNYAVAFTDDLHFNAFRIQNIDLINSEAIIIGDKTKESEAIRVNEANAKAEVAAIREKKDKVVENFEKSVTDTKGRTKLKLKVEKDD